MNIAKVYKAILLAMSLTFIAMPSAYAEKQEMTREEKIMRKLKRDNAIMKQQFEQEKKALQEQIQSHQVKINTLETALAEEQDKSKRLTYSLRKTKKQLTETEGKLAETEGTLANTVQNLKDMTAMHEKGQADLAFNEKQRKTQLENLAGTNKMLQTCEAKNQQLYDYGLALVQVYDDANAYKRLMRTEKLTQVKRVELENILQDYHDKITAERVSANQ